MLAPKPKELLEFIEEELSSRNYSKEEISKYFLEIAEEAELFERKLTEEIEDAKLAIAPKPLPLTSKFEENNNE